MTAEEERNLQVKVHIEKAAPAFRKFGDGMVGQAKLHPVGVAMAEVRDGIERLVKFGMPPADIVEWLRRQTRIIEKTGKPPASEIN
jgi:hypothetical protein